MVLINDKKYACATCIKGHRVSGCTHTDRPLFEVKKKGRPATQCQFCREKRKGGASTGSVHNKVGNDVRLVRVGSVGKSGRWRGRWSRAAHRHASTVSSLTLCGRFSGCLTSARASE